MAVSKKKPNRRKPVTKPTKGSGAKGFFSGILLTLILLAVVYSAPSITPLGLLPGWWPQLYPAPVAPQNTAPIATAPRHPDQKIHYSFYKILPGEQALSPRQVSALEKTGPPASKPVYLQAGSFHKPGGAEQRKAELAMLGLKAQTQSIRIDQKQPWYRVRVGPFQDPQRLHHARKLLDQNHIDYTPTY